MSKGSADLAAQLFCPVVLQLATTPMHLAGLDYYNRSEATLRDRWDLLKGNYNKSVVARMVRILPAFGFGGVGNKNLRTQYRTWLQTRDSAAPVAVPKPHIPILATASMAPAKP